MLCSFRQQYARLGTAYPMMRDASPGNIPCSRSPFDGYSLTTVAISRGGTGPDPMVDQLPEDYEPLTRAEAEAPFDENAAEYKLGGDFGTIDEESSPQIVGSGVLTAGGALRLAGQRTPFRGAPRMVRPRVALLAKQHGDTGHQGTHTTSYRMPREAKGSGILTAGLGLRPSGAGLNLAGSGSVPGLSPSQSLKMKVAEELRKQKRRARGRMP